jgi:hypothetical protein
MSPVKTIERQFFLPTESGFGGVWEKTIKTLKV